MNLKDTIRTIPDFPKLGIMYRDISTLVSNAAAFVEAVEKLAAPYKHKEIDSVAGIEARGFIFGAAVAKELGVGFIHIRKKGKLPGDTYGQEYILEYGTDMLEIQADSVVVGQQKILLIDDLIATGGSAEAAIKLLRKAGSNVMGASFVIDLPDLGGLVKIAKMGIPVTTLVSFEGH